MFNPSRLSHPWNDHPAFGSCGRDGWLVTSVSSSPCKHSYISQHALQQIRSCHWVQTIVCGNAMFQAWPKKASPCHPPFSSLFCPLLLMPNMTCAEKPHVEDGRASLHLISEWLHRASTCHQSWATSGWDCSMTEKCLWCSTSNIVEFVTATITPLINAGIFLYYSHRTFPFLEYLCVFLALCVHL